MKKVEPKIFLVGETKKNETEIWNYLEHIGVMGWTTNSKSDVEFFAEFFGRGCYESWEPGFNLNVNKIREGNDVYIKNIIKQKHGSVLEHSWLNWKICDVSRVFTHELVRHRVGIAISQQSQRYFRSEELGFWIPNDMEVISGNGGEITIQNSEDAKSIIVETVAMIEEQKQRLEDIFQLDSIKSFDVKKRLNTIIRRIFPEGMATDIGWSCNIRTLRHLLETRTSRHAEEEVRYVFGKIGEKVVHRFPNLFSDYKIEEVNGLPEYTTEFEKI